MIEPIQPMQRGEELRRRFASLPAQLARPQIRFANLRIRIPPPRGQRRTERQSQAQLLSDALRTVLQRLEQLQPLLQMTDCLRVSRPPEIVLARALPVDDRL